MPRYEYFCEKCHSKYFISHSYKEKRETCIIDNCDGNITKLMSKVNIKKNKSVPKKAGALVNQSIEEFKEDLKREKETLKKDRK